MQWIPDSLHLQPRDSEFGGHKMKEGDILGLENGKLEIIDKDPVHAATRLARSMSKRELPLLTIFTVTST